MNKGILIIIYNLLQAVRTTIFLHARAHTHTYIYRELMVINI